MVLRPNTVPASLALVPSALYLLSGAPSATATASACHTWVTSLQSFLALKHLKCRRGLVKGCVERWSDFVATMQMSELQC